VLEKNSTGFFRFVTSVTAKLWGICYDKDNEPMKILNGGIRMENKMFCFQCQETAGCKGCTQAGVCGKTPDVAGLQDLLVYVTKGIGEIAAKLRGESRDVPAEVNHLVTENLFMTITNANFDAAAIRSQVAHSLTMKAELLEQLAAKEGLSDAALWTAQEDAFAAKAALVGVLRTENEDVRSLRELITYGLKGLCAYMKHANALGQENVAIDAFVQATLAKLLDNTLDGGELTALAIETGKFGVDGMALLDKANTTAYGNPEITKVALGVRKNPGILISGHDLRDLEMLLEQTQDTGVDVYTHGEMLPAHYYPAFKKYPNFVGNYGNSWWKQKEEFEAFHGPILMTTNCVVLPKASYQDRLFTANAVGVSGCKHIEGDSSHKDFSEIIELAKSCPAPAELEQGELIGGFAHAQVFALADKVVEAVKSGAIKKFVVMAGCDGRIKSRDYYTEFAKALPKDTVILTAGCAKYRYIKLGLGDIGGIPRVLDAGQCNDSYSLALIALKLKEIFGLADINELPIVYNIAWYEQKAVIVLLALLSLGVKNIHLGPTLPAFLSPNVAKVLVDSFGIGGISDVASDIKAMLG
jgi:hydroxylamine reductase